MFVHALRFSHSTSPLTRLGERRAPPGSHAPAGRSDPAFERDACVTRAFEAALDLHLTLSEVTEENTATQLRTAIAALDEVINRLRHAALAQEVDDRL